MYIFICLTSKVLTVLYFPYSTPFTNTKYFILLFHHWQHQSIQTTINLIKHRFCLCCTGKYSTWGGVSKPHTAIDYASWCKNFSTPPLVLYFPYSTHTVAFSNIHIYIREDITRVHVL